MIQKYIASIPRPDLKKDLPASIAVFLVAVPLCLGIASASGSPILSGIVAGIVGGLIVSSISNSRLSVSGPAAGLTAIVFAGIQELQSFEAFLLAGLIAGIFQIFFGLLKAGVLGNYIPVSVIKGLLAAIGIILIFKQFPHVIGYHVEELGQEIFDPKIHNPSKDFFSILSLSLENIHLGLFTVGMGSLAIQIIWERIKFLSKIPSSLAAVVFGTILSFLFQNYSDFHFNPNHFVNIPKMDDLTALSNSIILPSFREYQNQIVWKYGIILALVASVETLLSIEAMDKLDPEKKGTSTNRELLAQGVGNTISALLGGIPVTAVIVRGTVNLNAGAKTKYSSIFHGLFLLLSLLFVSEYLNLIPLASLAAILCFTGYKLTSVTLYKTMYKKGMDQFIPFITAVFGIIFTDILYGTIIGGLVAIVFILKDVFYSPVVKVLTKNGLTKVFLGESVTFLHKAKIKQSLEEIKPTVSVYIDCRKSNYIHPDIKEYLLEFQKNGLEKNMHVTIQGKDRLLEIADRTEYANETNYNRMLEDNKDWVWEMQYDNPIFFAPTSFPEKPDFLVISCSEIKFSTNTITKAKPGIMMMHKNLGNIINEKDINLLSLLEYALINLNIKEIIICGHYNCNCFHLAENSKEGSSLHSWLQPMKEIINAHAGKLQNQDSQKKEKLLAEWNVISQMENLKNLLSKEQFQLENGHPLIKGWLFNQKTGIIREIHDPVNHFNPH